MRVGIVGAGAVGLAAAWNAARRGHAVEVFEAGPIPNPLAASMDQHRLCRVPYGSQDGYARLMAPAMESWERLWDALGERLYDERGCLALHTNDGDWTERSRASLARLGLPHAVLTPAQVAERFPVLRVEDARWGLWTQPGGVLFADSITAGFARLAAEAGAVLRPDTPAEAVGEDGSLRAGGTAFRFDAVLVAAGAWTPRLLPWTGDGQTPLRQVVVYAAPPPELAEAWAATPILLDMGGPRGLFCAPPGQGRGLKFGVGALNRPGEPDQRRSPEPGEAEMVLDAWRSRLALFEDYALTGARVCVYAGRADETFTAARRGRVVAITGCAGHAFKFAALLGEGLAAALEGGEAELRWMRGEAEAFDPRRLLPAA
ncbi:FAD-dependent oxidoreductase [Roseomonas sp. OT10]|uniref:FAD-dependent oxidoreductase n=1 Tax=Roseomonas cutis TaxID=2897332 RepID=UPI001E4C4A46|nr:FAD-dependent oxidoreductase [Roseomonas sp. OT10]UFN48251.1 FAD-dependent oxidoreductase [Roseomonas sp. OT10]